MTLPCYPFSSTDLRFSESLKRLLKSHPYSDTFSSCGNCTVPEHLPAREKYVRDVAERLRRAPRITSTTDLDEALLLNFTNPESKLCQAISMLTRVKTVGLCHGWTMGRNQIAAFL